jgi:hypothetical protein
LDDATQNSYKIIEKQTSSGEIDSLCWTYFAPKYVDLVIMLIVDFCNYKEFTVTCLFATNISMVYGIPIVIWSYDHFII